jgi:hypothetical protein
MKIKIKITKKIIAYFAGRFLIDLRVSDPGMFEKCSEIFFKENPP